MNQLLEKNSQSNHLKEASVSQEKANKQTQTTKSEKSHMIKMII